MKKLKLLICAVMLAAVGILLTGCSGDTFKTGNIEVTDISVLKIEENCFNFTLRAKNTSSEDELLDMSRFTLKLSSGNELGHYGGKENCPANKSIPFSVMIDDYHPEIKTGDSVTVYFDGEKVCEIKVKELGDGDGDSDED
jgi:hypothetical protein